MSNSTLAATTTDATTIKPRLTIGVPVYNAERYLEETLDCLLNQTYRDFKLVISDNGSNDRTQAICEEYARRDPRVAYHCYEKNRGAAWNFNNVFNLCDTEYFKWHCYDDLIAPDFLEECVAALDNDSSSILSYTRAKVINQHGEVLELRADRLDLRGDKPHQRWRQYFRNLNKLDSQFGVIRTDVLAKTGLMGNLPLSDHVLMAELALLGKFYEVPSYSFYYRFHPLISTQVHGQGAALAVFLDPRNKGKRVFPKAWRIIGYLKAVYSFPLSPSERLLCLVEIFQFIVQKFAHNSKRKLQKLSSKILTRLSSRSGAQ